MLAIFALAAVIPAFVAAQSIPSCALTCTLRLAGASACGGVTNVNCLCTNTDFQRDVFQCYVNTCTGGDLQAAAAYGAQTCAAVGVTLDPTAIPPGVTGAGLAPSSSGGSPAPASGSSSAAPTSSSTPVSPSSSVAPSSSAAGGTGAAAGAFERGNVLIGAVATFAGAAGLFAML